MKFVINTPNGNIGRVAAHKLLDAGHTLTVISRNPEKVKDPKKNPYGSGKVDGDKPKDNPY